MTAQPRRTSLLEAATQASVGLPLGFLVSYAMLMLRLPPAVTAALTTALMFAVSVARGYWIRRRFERRREATIRRDESYVEAAHRSYIEALNERNI